MVVTLRRIRSGGFASVSMRQVADELGITATALYHHFPNKDALLDEVVEQIYSSIPKPDAELHWTVRLRLWLLTQERVHLDHPGLARFILARHSQSTAAFRWIDTVLEILSDGGLSDDDAMMCMNQIGFLHNPLIYLDAPQREFEARASLTDPARRHVLKQRERFPHLARLAGRLPDGPQLQNFERALVTVIAGLEAAVDGGKRRRGRARPAR